MLHEPDVFNRSTVELLIRLAMSVLAEGAALAKYSRRDPFTWGVQFLGQADPTLYRARRSPAIKCYGNARRSCGDNPAD
jgi:hypothetical protein